MVIVKLSGGLGNQLFQVATAKSLANKLSCEFKIDNHFFNDRPNRVFELCNFSLVYQEISTFELYKTLHLSKYFLLDLITKNNRVYEKNINVFNEKHFQFDPMLYDQNEPVVLNGYWQSEKYFESISSEIRREFVLKNEVHYNSLPISMEISNCNSVSIHLRRGDYLNNPIINSIHGVLSDEYYLNSIEFLKSKTTIDEVFIFSDDVNSANEFIKKYNYGINISAQSKNALLDFHLLQKCKHNIIANSSFSWWAAWLNSNPNKMVIAPNNWFKDESIITDDLFPKSWKIL